MTGSEFRHTFAICAYKESPYLEDCIRSLKAQTEHSEIILSTSTPNPYIEGLCEKYGIPLYVNEGEKGITQDWNSALTRVSTPVVTIAHQDDVYFPDYVKELKALALKSSRPLIFFSDYSELRNGEYVHDNRLLRVKRLMLLPLRFPPFRGSRFVRRRILSMGSPICCPSVAFFRENLPEVIFRNHFRTNEDWEAWEMISKLKGRFLYCSRPLMAHRIHEGSETTAAIRETGRFGEDLEMFRKFWPESIARILCRVYGTSEKSNQV